MRTPSLHLGYPHPWLAGLQHSLHRLSEQHAGVGVSCAEGQEAARMPWQQRQHPEQDSLCTPSLPPSPFVGSGRNAAMLKAGRSPGGHAPASRQDPNTNAFALAAPEFPYFSPACA